MPRSQLRFTPPAAGLDAAPGPGDPEGSIAASAVARGETSIFDRLRPGPGQSRAAVVMSQRERLQRALAELATAGGYESVTVRKLTKLAKVSTGSFYAQFDGTDDCLVRTYANLMAAAREKVERARSLDQAHDEQCRQSIAALLTSLLENPTSARLTLLEVFSAGPAAVKSAQEEETRLELALRATLDRRGARVAPLATGWVVAGLFHCMRMAVTSGPARGPSPVARLAAWGQACLATPPDEVGKPRSPLDWAQRPRPAKRDGFFDSPGNETELILSGIMRLARTKGPTSFSPAEMSKASGVPAARFKRYFPGVHEAFLQGIVRTADQLFLAFRREDTRASSRPWTTVLCEQIASLSESVAADPDSANLVFEGMLAPGLIGLTRREAFIHETASIWRTSLPLKERPPAMVAEASMAALWGVISREVGSEKASRLPAAAAANAYLFLTPMVGTEIAAKVVANEFR